ncbi:MAG TPA: efflux RND transporter periplasmic adaptor subunit [Gemmatimonadaceae bacterium]
MKHTDTVTPIRRPPRRVGRLTNLLMFVATACAGAGDEAPAAEPSTPTAAVTLTPSDIATPREMELTAGISVSGSLEPSQTVSVQAQVGGRLRRVLVDRGTRVRRGQLLAQIEAEGVRGQAAGAQSAVISAEATEALAQQRLEAARRLNAAGAISDIELKTAETNLRAASAQLALARAQLATANEANARTSITAPIAGVISARSVEPGEAVKDGDELFQVVDISTLELQAQVGVDEAMNVRVGSPVAFTIDASGQAVRGRVSRIDPRADPGTRQVGLAAQLPNPGGRIVAGQFARGRVLTGGAVSGLAIPIAAVSDSAGVARVFVIENGRLVQRQVTLGARDEAQGLVVVTSGLTAGDRILARQVVGAANGLAVTIASDSAARVPAVPPGEK